MSDPKSTLVVGADTSGVHAELKALVRDVVDLGNAVEGAGGSMAGLGVSAEEGLKGADRATKALVTQIKNAAIDIETAGRSISDKFEIKGLAKGIDPEILAPYIARLRDAENAQAALAASAAATAAQVKAAYAEQTAAAQKAATAAAEWDKYRNLGGQSQAQSARDVATATRETGDALSFAAKHAESFGQSTKQFGNNFRGVGAQVSDIVVSLQGGQRPLTVLLQQGAQLKDMFGGVGGAARALGLYLAEAAAAVSPLLVLAAGAVTLGYAFYAGTQEAKEFAKALTITGNAAGVTVLELQKNAEAVAKASGGTVGAGAEAILALARSNDIASESFTRFGTVAVGAARDLGTAVADTVTAFAELGKDPVGASLKLNEAMHYLTAATYEQIKALEEQGKHEEAAALAQSEYATALEQRVKTVHDNLGLLSRGWQAVADTAKSAWDAMLDIGREDADPVGKITKQIAVLEGRLRNKTTGQVDTTGTDYFSQSAAAELAVLQQRKGLLEDQAKSAKIMAEESKKTADAQQAQVALDAEHDKYMTKDEKRRRELLREEGLYARADHTGALGAANAEKYAATIKGIEEKYKAKAEPKDTANAFAGEQEAAKVWAKAMEEAGNLSEKAQGKLEGLSAAQLAYKKYLDSTAAALNDKLNPAMGELLKAKFEVAIADERAAALAKEQAKYIEGIAKSYDKTADSLDKQIEKQQEHNATIGQTAESVARFKQAATEAATAELEGNADSIAALLEKNQLLEDAGDRYGLLSAAAKEAYEVELSGLNKVIEKRKTLALKESVGADREAAAATAKEAAQEWERGLKATQALGMSVFVSWTEGGTDSAKKIGDALKRAVAEAFYTKAIAPLMNDLYNYVMGSKPGAGGASGGSALSTLSSLFGGGSGTSGGLLSTAKDWVTGLFSSGGGAAAVGGNADKAALFSNAGYGSTAAAGAGGLPAGTAGLAGIPVAGWIAMGILASGSAYDAGFRGNSNVHGGTDPINAGLNAEDRLIGKPLGLDDKTSAMLSGSALGAAWSYFTVGGHTVTPAGSALTGTIGGAGASLQRRDDYTQDHRGVLGIGSYTTHNSEYTAADAGTTGYFDTAVKSINATAKAYAKAIGVSADAVDGFTTTINLSLDGLNDADKAKAVQGVLRKYYDDLTTAAFGGATAPLAKAGESASATFERVATNLTVVNTGLTLLGVPLLDLSVKGAEAATGLVDAAGGLEALGKSAGYYYEHFYSDGEKAANAVTALTASFTALGYTVPTSEAEFRSLIEGLDLTTAGGQKAAAGLLALAPAFDAVANNALASANKMLGALQDYGTSEEVRAFTVGMIQKGLADGGVNYTADQIANASRADFRAVYEQRVAAGDQRGADALLNQAKAFASITQPKAAAPVPTAGSGSSGGGGSSEASTALSAWQTATDAIVATMRDLRETLIGSGPDSFAKTQAQFAIEIAQAKAGDLAALQDLPSVAKSLAKLGETNSASAEQQALLTAYIIDALGQVINAPSAGGLLSVPHLATGTDYVPADMLAVVHKGEQIVPAQYTGNGNDALVAEIRALRLEVQGLRASTDEGADASRITAKVLTSAANGGQPLSTTT